MIRTFILLFALIQPFLLLAQDTSYASRWKQIDDLIRKEGRNQSAVAATERLYTLAKRERRADEMVRALAYLSGLNRSLHEDAELLNIDRLRKEIETAKTPVAQLLQSLLAKQYVDYLNQNRWKLYDRSKTNTEQTDRIDTWSMATLHRNIQEAYLQSLNNAPDLQRLRVEQWNTILSKGNSNAQRPTLYDILANEALDYFKRGESDLPKSSKAFEIDGDTYFAPAATFASMAFKSQDSLAMRFQALRLYQQVIAFHLPDAAPEALIDADLRRLAFVHAQSVDPDKSTHYQNALLDIANRYPNHALGMLAAVIRWEQLYEQSQSYIHGISDKTEQLAILRLHKAVKGMQKRFKGSNAQLRLRNLLKRMEQPSISGKTELVNVPDKPFLALVNYKNVRQFFYRIVKLPQEALDESDQDSLWERVLSTLPLRESQQTLPDFGDRREHSAEIKIDALSPGTYALVSSVRQDFKKEQNHLSLQLFHISRISYIQKLNDFFVLDRQSGARLANAEMDLMEAEYGYRREQTTYHSVSRDRTNLNGYGRLQPSRQRRPIGARIIWKTDTLFTRRAGQMYFDYRDQHQPDHLNTFLFTDRTIYRPGQTIYFKGILVNVDGERVSHQVVADQHTTMDLMDANGEKKASIELTTNEYGSYQGQFRIPEGGLTGSWHLRDQRYNAYKSFSVEEYKRPTFEVTWNADTGKLRVGDTVSISGSVKAYAGNFLNNSTVNYRVVRKPIVPRYWYWHFPERSGEQQEVASGEIRSNDQGKFDIRFKALPDRSISPSTNPSFQYEITAEVTDAGGESRSGQKTITLSYHPVNLELDLNETEYTAAALHSINVKATNFDGQPQDLPVTLTITRLKTPERLLKERFWSAPDTVTMDRQRFVQFFPNDPYGQENIPMTWAPEKSMFSITTKPGIIPMPNTLPSGYYLFELLTRYKGDMISDKRYIRVNGENTMGDMPRYLQAAAEKRSAEPGSELRVRVGTSAKEVYLIRQIDRQDRDSFKTATLSTEHFEEQLTIRDTDRGGLGVLYAFVKDNRMYSHTTSIEVPWSNKELNVEVGTYRDKLVPGAKETWNVKISGSKGEKVTAELLTSMYDASLDQFRHHEWRFPDLYRRFRAGSFTGESNFTTTEEKNKDGFGGPLSVPETPYDALIWNALPDQEYEKKEAEALKSKVMAMAKQGQPLNEMAMAADAPVNIKISGQSNLKEETPKAPAEPQVRKNFTETAFFFPQLMADKEGNFSFSFTLPESLTRWKWQMLAHTKDIATGSAIKEVVSQKPLMIIGQMPRFLREGDRIRLSARVSNLTEKEISGMALLQLIDPQNGQAVDGWFQNIFPSQYFTVDAGQSGVVHFEIQVPFNVNRPVTYRLTAKAGTFSDGEENLLPVLSNRGLVTESVPMLVKGNTTKSFELPGLFRSGSSSTLSNESITVEYATNPAWYAVLSLPYLMEYPYECAEQSFNRYYANAVASKVANSSLAIKQMFEQWKKGDSSVFLSNLMKNSELKRVLLEQTPWVFQAKNETQQRKNIAILFDQLRLAEEGQRALYRVRQMQNASGGFSWFPGGPDDRYITQYILTGMARLHTLQAATAGTKETMEGIAEAGLRYVDEQIKQDYERLIADSVDLNKNRLGQLQVQYLYLRSQWANPIAEASKKAYDYYLSQAQRFWLKRELMESAMLAVSMQRNGRKEIASAIIQSLEENSITDENLGMYWKTNTAGWYWYHAPIETQALLIEAFHATGEKNRQVENMKLWLLNQKRVQAWPSTKSTADAVFALLLTSGNTLSVQPKATIQLGDKTISSSSGKTEAGTGYMKERIAGEQVKPEMGRIRVTIKEAAPNMASWGAVHWQYVEEYDKIRSAETTVKLKRAFFIQRQTDRGPELEAVSEGMAMKVGDKLVVRIVLSADRDMEYMHLRDMRPSGTEPVNVLSRYQYRDGLGYYESTRDASSDFFFSRLPKGSWVFEYPLFVTHAGRFSAGISTIQSMYAPEFNAHSEGLRMEAVGND